MKTSSHAVTSYFHSGSYFCVGLLSVRLSRSIEFDFGNKNLGGPKPLSRARSSCAAERVIESNCKVPHNVTNVDCPEGCRPSNQQNENLLITY